MEADCPLLVICTVFGPEAPAGVVAVTVVSFTRVTPVAAVPPTVTVAPVAKLLPLSVMRVPPAVGPELGFTDVSVGAGADGAV